MLQTCARTSQLCVHKHRCYATVYFGLTTPTQCRTTASFLIKRFRTTIMWNACLVFRWSSTNRGVGVCNIAFFFFFPGTASHNTQIKRYFTKHAILIELFEFEMYCWFSNRLYFKDIFEAAKSNGTLNQVQIND